MWHSARGRARRCVAAGQLCTITHVQHMHAPATILQQTLQDRVDPWGRVVEHCRSRVAAGAFALAHLQCLTPPSTAGLALPASCMDM